MTTQMIDPFDGIWQRDFSLDKAQAERRKERTVVRD